MLAVATLVLLPEDPAPETVTKRDPTRRGPRRTLTIEEATVRATGDARVLHVSGTTNLVSGARLAVVVKAEGASVAHLDAVVADGRYVAEESATGRIVAGDYSVEVVFRLESQREETREALFYQPRSLRAEARLLLPSHVVAPAARAQDELRVLLEAVNRTGRSDEAELVELDARALALSERLWIATHKAAIRKLRLAIEERRKPASSRRDFERLLLEAHVLAGL